MAWNDRIIPKYAFKLIWEPTVQKTTKTTAFSDGDWDISDLFSKNLKNETPSRIEFDTLRSHFLSIVDDVTMDDGFTDGRSWDSHDTKSNAYAGTLFQYDNRLNWLIGLLLQQDNDPLTILHFARKQYKSKQDSIKGIIFTIGQELSKNNYSITLSQFRTLFLQRVEDIILSNEPQPYTVTDSPLHNFIATPAHFGMTLANEPGFIFDHITQKLAYRGILGEVIPVPFGVDRINKLDAFYHDVQLFIYSLVPDQYKKDEAINVVYNATTYNTSAEFSTTVTEEKQVHRVEDTFGNGISATIDENFLVQVDGVDQVECVDYVISVNKKDIIFFSDKMPPIGAELKFILRWNDDNPTTGTYYASKIFPKINQKPFDISEFVYPTLDDANDVRSYSEQDVQDKHETLFFEWLKVNNSWSDIRNAPFDNLNDANDPFTWNYRDDGNGIPVVWHEIYKKFFFTSGPQYEPWVIQGFDEKPLWWDEDFPPTPEGLYPYSSMWTTIENMGVHPGRVPPVGGTLLISYNLPINKTTGELLPPYSVDIVNPSMFTVIPPTRFDDFVFGDKSDLEMQWRNSVDYVWDEIELGYRLKPLEFITRLWDIDRLKYWFNGYQFDRTFSKALSNSEMTFYSNNEDVIAYDNIIKQYNFMGDGFSTSFFGPSYEFGSIEEHTGNGQQIDFMLEFPWTGPDNDTLVEVDGVILTEGGSAVGNVISGAYVDPNGGAGTGTLIVDDGAYVNGTGVYDGVVYSGGTLSNWQGVWTGEATLSLNDVVSYDGIIYKALVTDPLAYSASFVSETDLLVQHDLNSLQPLVLVDVLGVVSNVPYDDIEVVDENSLIVHFSTATSGDIRATLPPPLTTYTHTQAIGATQWTISHNLHTIYPVITILDNTLTQIFADFIEYIDSDTVILHFLTPVSGTADVLIYSDLTVIPYTQSTNSLVWSVSNTSGTTDVLVVARDTFGAQLTDYTLNVTLSVIELTFPSEQSGTIEALVQPLTPPLEWEVLDVNTLSPVMRFIDVNNIPFSDISLTAIYTFSDGNITFDRMVSTKDDGTNTVLLDSAVPPTFAIGSPFTFEYSVGNISGSAICAITGLNGILATELPENVTYLFTAGFTQFERVVSDVNASALTMVLPDGVPDGLVIGEELSFTTSQGDVHGDVLFQITELNGDFELFHTGKVYPFRLNDREFTRIINSVNASALQVSVAGGFPNDVYIGDELTVSIGDYWFPSASIIQFTYPPGAYGGNSGAEWDARINGEFDLASINLTQNAFLIDWNVVDKFATGKTFDVIGSTFNDGTFTILAATYDNTNTTIIVSEIIPNVLADGLIQNVQNWEWDIVGWDDIALGIDVPIRLRIGHPIDFLDFDDNDELNVYVDADSIDSSAITTIDGGLNGDELILFSPPAPFTIVNVLIENVADLIESVNTSEQTKLTTGLDQWYSQHQLYIGRTIDDDSSYSNLYRDWYTNLSYRTNNIAETDSVILRSTIDLSLRNDNDFFVELDSINAINSFYIDSFLIRVDEKTETSFDAGNNNAAPSSTIFRVDNFDVSRNFVYTAISREDKVFVFNDVVEPYDPSADVVLSGADSNGAVLAFRRGDIISLIIGTVFYELVVNVAAQTITLTDEVKALLSGLPTQIQILVEVPVRQLFSQTVFPAGRFNDTRLINGLAPYTFQNGSLNQTTYEERLEFEVNADRSLKTKEVFLPFYGNAQEVVDFLFEYERYTLEQGMVFDQLNETIFIDWPNLIDEFTGFVDSLELFSQIHPSQRHSTLNVLNSKLIIGNEFGVVGTLNDYINTYTNITQSLRDINNAPITSHNYQVLRNDSKSIVELVGNDVITVYSYQNAPFIPDYIADTSPTDTINTYPIDGDVWFQPTTSTFYEYDALLLDFVEISTIDTDYAINTSPVTIYTAHITLDQYESIIRLNDVTTSGALIHNPFSGGHIARLHLSLEKGRLYTGRPSAPGLVVKSNTATNQISFVKNIDANINELTHIFNAFDSTPNGQFIKVIPALLGLELPDYIRDIVGSSVDRSSIGFQQGFIRQKGARNNIKAIVNALPSINSIDLYDVWAYKVAEYGDVSGYDYVSVKLTEREGSRTILGINFVDANLVEPKDPVLINVVENNATHYPNLLDSDTTFNGSRFYFPAIDEASVFSEWERDYIQDIVAIGVENNAIPFGDVDVTQVFNPTNTNIITSSPTVVGFNFGTHGIGGMDRTQRIAGITIHQVSDTYTTMSPADEVLVEYIDASGNWQPYGSFPTNVNGKLTEIAFNFNHITTNQFRVSVVSVANPLPWGLYRIEMHRYRSVPDYDVIGDISAFNVITDAKLTEWYPFDPAEGIYPSEPYRYIDHDIGHNPAIFTHGDDTTRFIDSSRAWADSRVGEIWWDKSAYGVIDYKHARKFPSTTQRVSIWGKVAPGKSVQVYEWVKSPVPPSEWAQLVEDNADSEGSISERIPSGIVRNLTEYVLEVENVNNSMVVNYYFWVSDATKIGYTKEGSPRSLTIKQIAGGLEHPNNLTNNNYYIIENYLDSVPDWKNANNVIPNRFTQWFANRADLIFTSDNVLLFFHRKFILNNNLATIDNRGVRHEEWQLIHTGSRFTPPTQLWDDMVATAIDPTCANEADYNVNDPSRCFMPRDVLLQILNRQIVEINVNFFPNGYGGNNITGEPTFEQDTPWSGTPVALGTHLDPFDPLRDISLLDESHIQYFDPNDVARITTLLSRDDANSFWNNSTAQQINALFFSILEASLVFDTQKRDIFKTSYVTYNASIKLTPAPQLNSELGALDTAISFLVDESKPFHTHLIELSNVLSVSAEDEFVVECSDTRDPIPRRDLIMHDFMNVDTSDAVNIHTRTAYFDVVNVDMSDYMEWTERTYQSDGFEAQFTEKLTMMVQHSPNEVINVEFHDSVTSATQLSFDDVMMVESQDSTAPVEQHSHTNEMSVGMVDSIDFIEIATTFNDTVTVIVHDSIPLITATGADDGVWINDEVNVLFDEVLHVTDITPTVNDAIDVNMMDSIDVDVNTSFTDAMNVMLVDEGLGGQIHTMRLGAAFMTTMNANFTDSIEFILDGLEPAIQLVYTERESIQFIEALRIDVLEYNATLNEYYGFYMLSGGEARASYVPGDPLAGTPIGSGDLMFIGLSPGLDESPRQLNDPLLKSEYWYRWDGTGYLDNLGTLNFGVNPFSSFAEADVDSQLFDAQYYYSSFDNFASFDDDAVGFDTEAIGRAGYNIDGVGANTMTSTSNTARFIRSRPVVALS